MEFLSEDPTFLVGGLGIAALGCLVALKVTQQGKYLLWAGIAVGLALLFYAIEVLWVTDNERIEAVVYDLARAVAAGEGDKAASYLAPECRLDAGSETTNRMIQLVVGAFGHQKPADWLRENLGNLKFDYLYISRLATNAGAQSRLGTADFTATTMGNRKEPFAGFATPPGGMRWSFGFREAEPGVWKITRISPGRLDYGGSNER